MRRLALLSILAASVATAGPTAAPPAPPPAPTWADWVGDWDGKLTWKSCTADGEDRASIPIDANDGAMSIDLSPAGAALSALPLVEDGSGWVGQQGDVTVRVTKAKRGLDLAVDLDSGCHVRGKLERPSIGIPECDVLAAWARIESHCTKLTRPPLENAARLARQRATWRKARGEQRTKLAAQCTARSAKVEQELVGVGCAPHPDPTIGNRGAECQALRGIAARLSRCTALPSDQRDAYAREVLVLLAAAQGADKASLPIVDAECRRARDRLFAISQQVGCPP